MKIALEYRNPTVLHCKVAVFVNGALAGVLTLRQDEVGSFEQIVRGGCVSGVDTVESRGESLPSTERP